MFRTGTMLLFDPQLVMLGPAAYVILDNFGSTGFMLFALAYPTLLGTLAAWIGYLLFRQGRPADLIIRPAIAQARMAHLPQARRHPAGHAARRRPHLPASAWPTLFPPQVFRCRRRTGCDLNAEPCVAHFDNGLSVQLALGP